MSNRPGGDGSFPPEEGEDAWAVAARLDRRLRPEARRRYGAFHTPRPLVEALVERTLLPTFEAHLAEGASIGEDPTAFLRHALGFHLLDPAMGCGLFLQWAKEAMSARLIEVLETRGDGWPAASVAEGVAATALYGVDIQAEAVAAARRFLSSCEARHLRHANALLGIFRESGLPDRETWGAIDALLEAYASDLEHVPIFAAEREAFERRLRELSRRMRPLRNRLDAVLPRSLSHPKPLHWEVTFPEVFARRGGFDVVLGNPPFVRSLRQERKEKRFLERLFSFAEGNFDLYVCFVELAWRLVRPGGRIGLILPDGVLTQRYARRLRRTLLSSGTIEVIEEVTGGEHFDGASVHPLLLVVRKSAPLSNHRIRIRRQGAGEESGGEIELAQAEIGGGEETVIRIVPPPLLHFLREMARLPTIGSAVRSGIVRIFCGTPRARDYRAWGECLSEDPPASPFRKYIVCANLSPYAIEWGIPVTSMGRWLHTPYFRLDALSPSKAAAFMHIPKLIVRANARRLSVAYDETGYVFVGAYGMIVTPDSPWPIEALLALLNTRILDLCYRAVNRRISGGYLSITASALHELPLPVPDATNRPLLEEIGALARKLVRDHALRIEREHRWAISPPVAYTRRNSQRWKRLGQAQGDPVWTAIVREIEATERAIDRIACRLYGRSEEEIEVLRTLLDGKGSDVPSAFHP